MPWLLSKSVFCNYIVYPFQDFSTFPEIGVAMSHRKLLHCLHISKLRVWHLCQTFMKNVQLTLPILYWCNYLFVAVQMYSPLSFESTEAISSITNPKSDTVLILEEFGSGFPLNFQSIFRSGSLVGVTVHSKCADMPSLRLVKSY